MQLRACPTSPPRCYMTAQDLELLIRCTVDPKVNAKPVRISTTEGEILIAFVLHVCEEEQDVTYEVIRTNQPERYSEHRGSAFVIPLSKVAHVEEHFEEGQTN